MSKATQSLIENNNFFYCAITDSLITEYGVFNSDLSVDTTFKGIYWEASVYFEKNDFILNAYTESVDGVKEIEVLRFPTKKISEAKISDASSGKEKKSDFKFSLIIGSSFGLMVFLVMLIHPEQGYSEIGTVISISLFFAFGATLVVYFFQIMFKQDKFINIIEISIITNDNRVITLFGNIDKKEWIKGVLVDNSIKIRE